MTISWTFTPPSITVSSVPPRFTASYFLLRTLLDGKMFAPSYVM